MSGKRYDWEKVDAELRRLIERGNSAAQCAKALGIGRNTLRDRARLVLKMRFGRLGPDTLCKNGLHKLMEVGVTNDRLTRLCPVCRHDLEARQSSRRRSIRNGGVDPGPRPLRSSKGRIINVAAASHAATTDAALRMFVRAETAMPWEREAVKEAARRLAGVGVSDNEGGE